MRLTVPGSCLLVVLVQLSALQAEGKCPNWCSQHGICTGPEETDHCICEIGYVGDDCGTRLCPKGDDPTTTDQVPRTIQMRTGATRGTLAGEFNFLFNGESVTFDATAALVDGTTCSKLVTSLPNVASASCERGPINEWGGATYTISFDAWPTQPFENNLYNHDGNPSLQQFACNMTAIYDSAWAPWCELDDPLPDAPVKEYAECSNHGTCDRALGRCACALGFKGAACDDMKDADDVAVHIADGPFFSASVLKLRASREPSREFNLLQAIAGTATALTLTGTGDLSVSGDFESADAAVSSLAVNCDDAEGVAIDVNVTANAFTGAVVSATVASPAPGSLLLDLSAEQPDDAPVGLRVAADGAGAEFAGPGGVAITHGGGLTVAGAAAIEGDVSVGGAVKVEGGVSAAALSAGSAGLSASLTAQRGAAAALSATHGAFAGTVLSLDLAAAPGAAGADAALLRATCGGEECLHIGAGGAVTVRRGGVAVERGGLTVASGGVSVGGGGLEVQGGIVVASGTLRLPSDEGMTVDGGGISVSSRGANAAALTAAATARGFAGAVVRVEAAHGGGGGSGIGGSAFRLLEGAVGGEVVLEVGGDGAVSAAGDLSSRGDVVADGALIAKGGAVLARAAVPAGDAIDLAAVAARGGFVSVTDDGAARANRLRLPPAAAAAAGALLLVQNGDAQALAGDAAVPPGHAVLFVFDGERWRDVNVLNAAVTRLEGVTKLTAAEDLDIGERALRAGALLAGGNEEGGIAVYGAGGLLTSANGLEYDGQTETVTVPRLKVGEMASAVDFRGFGARNVALANVTLDELAFLKVGRVMLSGAARVAAADAVRVLGVDARGEVVPIAQEALSLGAAGGGVVRAQELHVGELRARTLGAAVDCAGNALRGAVLEDVAGVTGLRELALGGGLTLTALAGSEGAILQVDADGRVSAAAGASYADGALHASMLRIAPDGEIDMGGGGALRGAALRGGTTLEGELTGGTLRPDALEAARASLGATTMTGALDLGGMPLLNVRAEDLAGGDMREARELTVTGDLRLAGRDAARGRLLTLGQDGAIVPAQAERLAVECDSLQAGRAAVSTLAATGTVSALALEAESVTATGAVRAARVVTERLQLDGDADGGGHKLSNVALERVSSLTGLRSLTVDGDLAVADFRGAEREGSLLVAGDDGRLALAGAALRWRDGALAVPRLSAHSVAGDVDMGGHALRGAHIDLAGGAGGGGGISGLRDLRVGGALGVGGDAFLEGALTVAGGVTGGGPYMDSSDARLKANVRALGAEGALAALRRLRAVTYEWDEGAAGAGARWGEGRAPPKGEQIGMLAQEVEAVLPLLVAEGSDGYKSVAYARLTPVLVEGVKLLAAQNDALQDRVRQVEERLARLEAALLGHAHHKANQRRRGRAQYCRKLAKLIRGQIATPAPRGSVVLAHYTTVKQFGLRNTLVKELSTATTAFDMLAAILSVCGMPADAVQQLLMYVEVAELNLQGTLEYADALDAVHYIAYEPLGSSRDTATAPSNAGQACEDAWCSECCDIDGGGGSDAGVTADQQEVDIVNAMAAAAAACAEVDVDPQAPVLDAAGRVREAARRWEARSPVAIG
ncbi:hypothetical protein JKP88DRAFT_347960 [Tribonema minus]|uniref:EGF-like domain-containing protein n=1 Tax=Tribonema minus TaxID=303371 RepID=A0A835Z997_9STRA|nr:hypothetical protein JKP88DRAFT_347960 [Tribonema minus]